MEKLKERLTELVHLRAAIALLAWDQETYMPPRGSGFRGATLATLSGLAHAKGTAPEFATLVNYLEEERKNGKLSEEEAHIVREVKRDLDRTLKVPVSFVKEFTELTSRSFEVWREARAKSDFKLFAPELKKIVEMNRQYAEFFGYNGSPYNALLDGFEPNMTTERLDALFADLKKFLVPFLEKVRAKKYTELAQLQGNFPVEKQWEFGLEVLERIGFDLQAGRQDKSTHPFTMGLHPADVRLTTRLDEHHIVPALFATIHEGGHGLYEQGLLEKHHGTPLGEATSHGLHESQSRLWENLVGRSRPFWEYFYPKLQKLFPKPFAKLSFDEFYWGINRVEPSAIRVEADEVTYNLHIILRYEIERALLEGTVQVEDLPELWSAKMKSYLGYDVKNDAEGVLQDIHWSHGSFGYFPTYTLGNLFSAQLYAGAQAALSNLENDFRKGEFKKLRNWLKEEVHAHGRAMSAEAIVERASGKPVSAAAFKCYLEKKFEVR